MGKTKGKEREQISIVIVGHVDHGKSTVVGRMLADTDSLPEGKLEQVKAYCEKNSRPFEYAYLLDALKDEQSQGITIDSARCFFKSDKRDYIIIDAPGHIEFLKNMVSGAARAEAAVLVIDANEGIKENSKRHGYMLSMLGITQVIIAVNKMDLVDYSQETFEKIKKDYTEFLKKINISPKEFIPVSGLKGDNIVSGSKNLSWFRGNSVLSALDSFEKEKPLDEKPFRMPLQDVYRFTEEGDDRRLFAGRIESGKVSVGDEVIFLPSNKKSKVKSIEEFNAPKKKAVSSGYSTSFTLEEQVYIKRGELMAKASEPAPKVSSLIKANIFWMGKKDLVKGKKYFMKIGTAKIPAELQEIGNILDASSLSTEKKDSIGRHDVAECTFETKYPVAFDLAADMPVTSRFVIVDDYEISGGGIITEFVEDSLSGVRRQTLTREEKWEKGLVRAMDRVKKYGQKPMLILLTGKTGVDKKTPAKQLEKELFERGMKTYFLGIGNILRGLDSDIAKEDRKEHIRRLGEVVHILLDAGLVVITTASDLTEEEVKMFEEVSSKEQLLLFTVGKDTLPDYLVNLNLKESGGSIKKIVEYIKSNRMLNGSK